MTVTKETQLENYTLESEIGRGDLSTVYRAHRKSDKAAVAIKIVAPQFTFDEVFVQRFKDAARQATKLEHPNIVRTYEAGQEDSVLYVVREFIEGRPLARVIQEEGPLPNQRMLIIARQISAALDYAHQKSITHGDLSAHNIYVDLNSHITVADFGQTQAIASTSLAKQGFAVGSPETIAPERVHGQGPSRQSDLYSLGVLCYQMLAGEPPFKGTPTAVLHAQAYEQPRPLHLINPSISVAMSEAIDRMLAKGLELRYNTGAEFSRALEVAIQGTAPMRAPAAAAAQLKAAGLDRSSFWQRSWVWLGMTVVAIGLILVLGFGAVSIWNAIRPLVGVSDLNDDAVSATGSSSAGDENRPGLEITVPTVKTNVETTTAVPDITATPTLVPTVTPTLVPLPTPGPPTIAENSPFTTLVMARGISDNDQPQKIGTSFAPGSQPIYIFFDYDNIQSGTTWTHRWTWGDTELDTYQDVWPDFYSDSGTAWVFYSPAGGFEPGPYKVTLEVNGRTVVTATFVIQSGGL